MSAKSSFALSLLLAAGSSAAPASQANDGAPSKVSDAQIRRMMDAINWPQTIDMSLKRGDLQRAAKSRNGGGPARARCIDEKYTRQRVLTRIAAGYLRVYDDPAIVAAITAHHETTGARRLMGRFSERVPSLGAKGAYEAGKLSAYDALTPEEKREFGLFGLSPAGKQYLAMRPTQLIIHQEELDALERDILAECGQ
jgi:hypothetical protein